jgi:hypothetical protein
LHAVTFITDKNSHFVTSGKLLNLSLFQFPCIQ